MKFWPSYNTVKFIEQSPLATSFFCQIFFPAAATSLPQNIPNSRTAQPLVSLQSLTVSLLIMAISYFYFSSPLCFQHNFEDFLSNFIFV